MRTFILLRHNDISGISGTGVVAEGAVFTDGVVIARWFGEHPSTFTFNSVEDLLYVHGHNGATELLWDS